MTKLVEFLAWTIRHYACFVWLIRLSDYFRLDVLSFQPSLLYKHQSKKISYFNLFHYDLDNCNSTNNNKKKTALKTTTTLLYTQIYEIKLELH